MQVRDQHGVDAAERPGVDLGGPAQVRDAVSEQRVGEQPDAVQVDEDGRVADVLDRWRGTAWRSRRDPTPPAARPSGTESRFRACRRRPSPAPIRHPSARAPPEHQPHRAHDAARRGDRRARGGVRDDPGSGHDAVPGAVLRARAGARRAADAAPPAARPRRLRDHARARADRGHDRLRAAPPDPARGQLPRLRPGAAGHGRRHLATTRRSAQWVNEHSSGARDRPGEREGDRSGHRRRGRRRSSASS